MARTELLDTQKGLMGCIKLDRSWERRVAGLTTNQDRESQIEDERRKLEQKLKRLARAYVDGFAEEEDFTNSNNGC